MTLGTLFNKSRASIRKIKEEDECISPYDVKALSTPVPIESAFKIIKEQLECDRQLHQRIVMTVDSIISLLEFCLNNTIFCFRADTMSNWKRQPLGHL